MYRPPRSLTPASFSPPELSNLWVRNGPKILPPKTGKCGINGVLLMNWICCVYGVFPGNLLKSHNLNPLFFPFRRCSVWWQIAVVSTIAQMLCVSKLCHSKSVLGCLGLRNQLELLWKNCSDRLGVAGWKHVKTTVGWSSYYWNDYRFIHPITNEIPMITGLVFTGKFTPETPYLMVKTMVSG